MNKFIQYIKEPWRAVVAFDRHIWSIVPDSLYLKCMYRCLLGKKLDLKNPKGFYEKLNWLKLYDRRPEYTTMVDKYAVKEYVGNIIGKEYIIPLLGVWNTVEEIDFDALPDRFVLKCSHGSGDVVICKDKSSFDRENAKRILAGSMKRDLSKISREWPYKNVKRRIIAEQYLEDTQTGELRDYKFFTYNGKAKLLLVASNRQSEQETNFDWFDMDYHRLDLYQGHPGAPIMPEKPKNFDRMREFAELLAKDIPHVRVDFYEANGRLYFGELTFSDSGGFDTYEPESWDRVFGDWITLPPKTGHKKRNA